MWPTPSASDRGRTAINPIMTKNGTIRHQNKQGGQSYARLDQVAAMYPTPQAGDYRSPNKNPGTRGTSGQLPQSEHSLPTLIGGQLNPDWVEWLMGFPIGHTDADADNTQQLDSKSGWWPKEPEDIPRIATGIKNRVGRLTSLGNAVVRQQFHPVFQAIADIERAMRGQVEIEGVR